MADIDRSNRLVHVAPMLGDARVEIVPRRRFHYDTPVIAIGSQANDFGVPGMDKHCLMPDTLDEAREVHVHLINACQRTHTQHDPVVTGQLTVGIVGTAATGVELAAELHGTTRELLAYGQEKIDPYKNVKLIIEKAADRVLPGLPPQPSTTLTKCLEKLGVELHLNERVVKVRPDGFVTASGNLIPSSMMVWSADIKAPDFLSNPGGFETNRINQLVVRPTLHCSRDNSIFELVDSSVCPMLDKNRSVPSRAQATHQQASMLVKSIGYLLPNYIYREYGSLVELSRYSTFGHLSGRPERRQSHDRKSHGAPGLQIHAQDASSRTQRHFQDSTQHSRQHHQFPQQTHYQTSLKH